MFKTTGEEAPHMYYSTTGKRRLLISATQHLWLAGLTQFPGIPAQTLFTAAKRGTRVHSICEQWLKGGDPEPMDDTDDELWDRYLAFKKWWEGEDFEVEAVETVVKSDVYATAGTIDIKARRRKTGKRAIIDIKTGSPKPETAIQLAIYVLLDGDLTADRLAIYLPANGRARPESFTDRNDIRVAQGIIASNWWMLTHGIMPLGAHSNDKLRDLCTRIMTGEAALW